MGNTETHDMVEIIDFFWNFRYELDKEQGLFLALLECKVECVKMSFCTMKRTIYMYDEKMIYV